MTETSSNDHKRVRIVHQLVGPVQRLHVREVPGDSVIHTSGVGPSVEESVKVLRLLVKSYGYVVEPGFVVEDWRDKQ
jgi:hypothetical protein